MLANKSGSLTKRVVIPVDQTHNAIPVDQTHIKIMSQAIEEVAAAMSSMSAQTFSISTISDGCGA